MTLSADAQDIALRSGIPYRIGLMRAVSQEVEEADAEPLANG
jgi:hypothetical protein